MRLLVEQPQGHHQIPHHRLRDGSERTTAIRKYVIKLGAGIQTGVTAVFQS